MLQANRIEKACILYVNKPGTNQGWKCKTGKTTIHSYKKLSYRWQTCAMRLEVIKVIKHSTIPYVRYSFLLCNSNFVFKTRRFCDIWLQKCCDLENQVRDRSRSLEMSPCDRAHMTSYWRSIVTMALSHVVSEIFNVEKSRDLEMGVWTVTQGHWEWYPSIDCVWFPISVL